MSRRTYALFAIVSLLVLSGCVIIANNFYWSAAPGDPRGEYVFFHDPIPEVLGQILWLVIKPLLLVSILATPYFAYRYVRALTKRKIGFCPRCGYDLRASTGRCPECGEAIP
jgi:hypothetical protein